MFEGGVFSSGHRLSARSRRGAWRAFGAPAAYLDDLDPELAEELQRELALRGHGVFAEVVFDLRVREGCACGDPACASFFTVGRSDLAWMWFGRWKTLPLRADPLLAVAVWGKRIVGVEVAGRPLLREVVRFRTTVSAG